MNTIFYSKRNGRQTLLQTTIRHGLQINNIVHSQINTLVYSLITTPVYLQIVGFIVEHFVEYTGNSDMLFGFGIETM